MRLPRLISRFLNRWSLAEMTKYRMTSGSPKVMGVTHDGEGANFAVFSANADKIELCLFSDDGTTELQRLLLPEKTGPIWHGYVPGVKPGQLF